MKPVFTKPFVRDYQKLPPDRQEQFDKQLELLLKNSRHPSLQARIVDPKRRIWKAIVGAGYRFTFQIERDTITLRRTGTHDEMERPEHW
jgi:mRNA-degrading endonuclease RelE of RelBE toxin-antitoxin system